MLSLTNYRENGQLNIEKAIKDGVVRIDELEKKGAREKFWCNNYSFLYKRIFDDSYEDFAELIAHELATMFGIKSAEYDLATYEENRGVITYNVVKDDNCELISGTDIINIVFEQHIKPLQNIYSSYLEILNKSNLDKDFNNYNEISRSEKNNILNKLYLLYKESNISSFYISTLEIVNVNKLSEEELKQYFNKFKIIFDEIGILYDYNENEYYNGIMKANNLFDLWSIIEKYCNLYGYVIDKKCHPIEMLMYYFVFDIITSQGDRHADNWSIVVNHTTNLVEIAPLYDNSNICNLNRSKAIVSIKDWIELCNNSQINEIKKNRMKERIANSINHSKIGLKLNPTDVVNKEKNIKQIKEFVRITDISILEDLIFKITNIKDNIDNVFINIEDKINIKIPEVVKSVVSYTIKYNIDLFVECYYERIGRCKK